MIRRTFLQSLLAAVPGLSLLRPAAARAENRISGVHRLFSTHLLPTGAASQYPLELDRPTTLFFMGSLAVWKCSTHSGYVTLPDFEVSGEGESPAAAESDFLGKLDLLAADLLLAAAMENGVTDRETLCQYFGEGNVDSFEHHGYLVAVNRRQSQWSLAMPVREPPVLVPGVREKYAVREKLGLCVFDHRVVACGRIA